MDFEKYRYYPPFSSSAEWKPDTPQWVIDTYNSIEPLPPDKEIPMSAFDKYKIFTPSFLDDEDEKNNEPIGYDWEWKPNTPQSVIDDYNSPKHYWNYLKE